MNIRYAQYRAVVSEVSEPTYYIKPFIYSFVAIQFDSCSQCNTKIGSPVPIEVLAQWQNQIYLQKVWFFGIIKIWSVIKGWIFDNQI